MKRNILIAKKNLWISITTIALPILILLILKNTDVWANDLIKAGALNIAKSVSLLGMFLLFLTKWTKDDGDEMYLQFRLASSLSSVIFGAALLLVNSVIDAFTAETAEDISYMSGFYLMYMVLFWQLFTFGMQVYRVRKTNDDN